MRQYRRPARLAAVAALGAAVTLAAGLLARPGGHATPSSGAAERDPRADVGVLPAGAATDRGGLAADLARLQRRLRDNPADAVGWATLGIDYVQQAKDTVDPAYYPKAAGALRRSLRLQPRGNVVALVGMADLSAAEHRFGDALRWARRATRLDPRGAAGYGALADALTQLGRYRAAAVATQRMVDLRPGAASFARASYVLELRGDVRGAGAVMRRSFADATTSAQRAFAAYNLGELARNAGRPRAALAWQRRGLRLDPTYPDLLEGKARAEAALGWRAAALRDFATVTSRVPQPAYLAEAADYLSSLGRRAAAARLYHLVGVENRLLLANGVKLDSDATLFYADHGQPVRALRLALAAIRTRPFLDMADALAWALHVNHRDRAALRWVRRARGTGMRNPLYAFHAGMIERALGHRSAARHDLATALRTNPRFSPLLAPVARRVLAGLDGRR